MPARRKMHPLHHGTSARRLIVDNIDLKTHCTWARYFVMHSFVSFRMCVCVCVCLCIFVCFDSTLLLPVWCRGSFFFASQTVSLTSLRALLLQLHLSLVQRFSTHSYLLHASKCECVLSCVSNTTPSNKDGTFRLGVLWMEINRPGSGFV